MIRWIIFKFRDWIKDVNMQYDWIQHQKTKEPYKESKYAMVTDLKTGKSL